ncbi:hypothetical protein GCM10010191_68240 [Actinomadura vinacea]|uniref:Uncharacterized protein n=1 Tax=Actinomadura vinacea TaxID=115336 RepID=A0ABP5X193_9ACTN
MAATAATQSNAMNATTHTVPAPRSPRRCTNLPFHLARRPVAQRLSPKSSPRATPGPRSIKTASPHQNRPSRRPVPAYSWAAGQARGGLPQALAGSGVTLLARHTKPLGHIKPRAT